MAAAEAKKAIPATHELSVKMTRAYYSHLRSRSGRISYVRDLLVESDRMIRDNLCEARNKRTPDIESLEIFVGQDSAWEAALRNAPRSDLVLIGPFSSPGVSAVIEACCSVTRSVAVRLQGSVNDSYLDWRRQEEAIIATIHSALDDKKSVTLVINHVSYASGLKIPLQGFIQRLKNDFKASAMYIIVDGTNAVGNRCRVPTADDWDAYVFYPHRWLLAPEPTSVVLTRNVAHMSPAPYGSMSDRRVSYDEVVSAIAGLRAGLEVVQSRELDYFWSRCEALRRAFIGGLPRSVRLLGSQSDSESTFILSCYPSGTGTWRRSVVEMDDSIGKICASASFLTIDEKQPWMRLTLPYYLDPRELNRLNSFLEENTSD
jgi:hypothetical protein